MKRWSAMLVLVAVWPAGAAIYTVNPDGSGDYPTIQTALDAAADGDAIQLGDGVFTGDGNRDLDFAGKSIVVASASTNAEACVIDCQATANDLHRGFYFHSGEDASAAVRGVTILRGYADGGWPGGSGGAILCYQSSPTIENCRFADNHAGWGGAVSAGDTDLTLTKCTFYANGATHRGGAVDAYNGVNLVLDRCTLVLNQSAVGGGVGGNHNCDLDLSRTIIAFSTAGGAVGCTNFTVADAACCDVFANAEGDYAGCLEGQSGADGNLSADPLFCDPATVNLRLQPGSPCAPENQPVCGLIGAWPTGCTAHEPVTLLVRPDGTGEYPTIQAALDAAADGDTVALDDGVFTGPGNRDLSLWGKAVTVRGRSGDASVCAIDCQGSALAPHRGFSLHMGPSLSGRIEDLTIANGYATGDWPEGSGGAILCHETAPVIAHCRFIGNRADWGGAVSAGRASVPLEECVFSGNRATYRGGGADGYDHAGLQIDHCTFVGNSSAAGSAAGGNIYCAVNLNRTILAFSPDGVPIAVTGSSSLALSCGDVAGNADGDFVGALEGLSGQNGNFSADPLFCDPDLSDLRLQTGSPCAPAQQPSCGLIGALPVGCETLPPTVRTVRPDGSGEYPTIQAAIDAAHSGDIVELTDGTFAGPGNRDIELPWASVTVRSRGGDPDSCRIECEGAPGAPHRGFHLGPTGATGSRLEHLTVSGGYADLGGAVQVEGGGLAIEGCVFTGCRAREGGGVYGGGGEIEMADCAFRENAADSSGGGLLATGDARATLRGCVFEGNSAALQGGGLCVHEAPPIVLSDCSFEGNHSMLGGGAALRNAGAASVTSCVFRANDVIWGGGGGLFCEGGAPAVDSCLFVENIAPRGGGLSSWGSNPTIDHCTFAGNGAGQGGGLWSRGGQTAVRHTIIAFSASGHAVHCDYDYSVALECSDLYGNAGGDWVDCIGWMAGAFGNLSLDPLFCGEQSSNGAYALREESPCAPENNPGCGLIGAGPVGCEDPAGVDPPVASSWAHALLRPNRPNPFADFTEIAYVVPGAGAPAPVRLAIYDAAGRRVRTLAAGTERPGPHRTVWDGCDAAGAPAGTGVYFCRITAGGETLSRRMVLIR
jgi:hypothetical protein